MKKLIIIILTAFTSLAAYSQKTQYIGLPDNTVEVRNKLRIDALKDATGDSVMVVDAGGNVKLKAITDFTGIGGSSGPDSLYLESPIYSVKEVNTNGDTIQVIKFRADSLPELRYAAATRDTNNWIGSTLVDVDYLNNRILNLEGSITNYSLPYDGISTHYLGGDTLYHELPAQVNADWNSSSGVSQILNKPTLFSGSYIDLTDKPIIPSQFNPIAGDGISLSGTYPNIMFTATAVSGTSSSGVDSTNIAVSAGQSIFSFPYTLSSFTVSKQVIRNGVLIDPADYTISGSDIIFTSFTCDVADKIRFIGIK